MNFVSKIFVLSFILLDLQNMSRISTMTNATDRNHPSVVMIRKLNDYFFPSCARTDAAGKTDYSEVETSSKVIHFCPTPNAVDIQFLKHWLKYDYCLFEDPEGGQGCVAQPEPTIQVITTKKRYDVCSNDQLTAYEYGYPLCSRPNSSHDDTTKNAEVQQNPEKTKPQDSSRAQLTRKGSLNDLFAEQENHDEDNYERIYSSTLLPTQKFKRLYTLCFDHQNKRLSHISYTIMSPKLFNNKALAEGQETVYTGFYSHAYNNEALQSDLSTIAIQVMVKFWYRDIKAVMLAPDEDTPLNAWKNPFRHVINRGLIYSYLVGQWKAINDFVRNIAIEKQVKLKILVGKINEKTSISYTWWKIVSNPEGTHGMGIILRNIPKDSDDDTSNLRLIQKCTVSCQEYGFGGMILGETASRVACCDPRIIAKEIDLKFKYFKNIKLLNVNTGFPFMDVKECPE